MRKNPLVLQTRPQVKQQLYRGMSKAYSSIPIRMRTDMIRLNPFLYKVKARGCDQCTCEQGSQAPKHVLIDCSLWNELRQEMWTKVCMYRGDSNGLIHSIMPYPKLARYLLVAADLRVKTGLRG
jgi:hypothetical protein